jgi:hypothetical protein
MCGVAADRLWTTLAVVLLMSAVQRVVGSMLAARDSSDTSANGRCGRERAPTNLHLLGAEITGLVGILHRQHEFLEVSVPARQSGTATNTQHESAKTTHGGRVGCKRHTARAVRTTKRVSNASFRRDMQRTHMNARVELRRVSSGLKLGCCAAMVCISAKYLAADACTSRAQTNKTEEPVRVQQQEQLQP